jgi:hypothetical protein
VIVDGVVEITGTALFDVYSYTYTSTSSPVMAHQVQLVSYGWAVSRILDSVSLVCWSGGDVELVAGEGFGWGAVAEGGM